MSRYELVDTFPAFDRFWRGARDLPVDLQIQGWRRGYLRPWPELVRKQITDYRRVGVDWREVAKRRVFSTLEERLPRMRRARASIRRAIPNALHRFHREFGRHPPFTFVIHVGIGCGAGWATTFGGRPAVLFGLENAAELGWTDPETTVALVEHELAHLLHDRWRRAARRDGIGNHRGPWWQLYEEGFATYCEIALGPIGGHHSTGRTWDWLDWCQKHRRRLASSFLRTVSSRHPTRRFFGSWNPIDGYIDTGYFLGSEVIRDWRSRIPLRRIACWTPEEVRRRGRSSLRRLAAAGGGSLVRSRHEVDGTRSRTGRGGSSGGNERVARRPDDQSRPVRSRTFPRTTPGGGT